jgi:hypothetical protein
MNLYILNSILIKMFVIIDYEMPDVVLPTFNDMSAHLIKYPSCQSIEYVFVDKYWVAGRLYSVIEDNEIVFSEAGTWNCSPAYQTYTFPNKCPQCDTSEFMKAKYCTLCAENTCEDCGKSDEKCICLYNDY